jgi:hypothetical protein
MTGKAKAPGLARRVARLLVGRSTLRRRSDRVEGAVAGLLSVVFLGCTAGAALFGLRFCQVQSADAARLHPAVAVVSKVVPDGGALFSATEVVARWRAPDGKQRLGVLTNSVAPGVSGAQAGSRVRVWLTASGDPVARPSALAVVLTAVVMSATGWCGAGIVLGVCYLLCRVLLDRRRLAGWESDWALTGPRWSSRR